MKTSEVEVALFRYLDYRVNLIIPNISWGMFLCGRFLHECDILMVTKSGYATEVEIKVTKADLLKDKKKWHNHKHPAISKLYFAVPDKLKDIALKEIPERAGLYCVYENKERPKLKHVRLIRDCKKPKNRYKWTMEEMYNAARLGAMRIYNLKLKLTYA